MQYQEEKFINALLFFAKNTDPEIFGSKKLWKLLFVSDIKHYKQYGRSILEDVYRERQFGPVPDASFIIFKDTFEEGVKTNLVNVAKITPTPVIDYTLDKIEPLKDFDPNVFSESELEIMTEVAKKYYSKRGGEIEKEVKQNPIIKNAELFSIIDYKQFLEDENDREYVRYWEQEDKLLDQAVI